MAVIAHRAWEWEDPLVLVGFPSQGLVGAITASYLVPRLDMQLVASMDSPHFPPVASVRDGRALSPVQFYASRQRCGLDGECSQLVVVRSDVAPPPEHAKSVAREVLAWAESVGARRVVALEGAPGDEAEEPPRVFGVPNLECELDHDSIGTEPFPSGAMSGMAAALSIEGNRLGLGVITLFTSVHDKLPDASAAARLINVADVLVPGIKMDTKPLETQARSVGDQLRASLAEQERAAAGHPMMYG